MSSPRVSTFLWFDADVREVVEFYRSIFPNTEIIETIDYNKAIPSPDGDVMTIEFELNGYRIVAFTGGPDHPFTDAISIQVEVEAQPEVDFYWNALTADGGSGIACGWLEDKYGLHWQIVPAAAMKQTLGGPDPEGARRAGAAMMKMIKLDVADLHAAYAGT